tara:strand:+ start:862 stop:1584 length:723 start_codon:yes stop_codon:yes gene_type:complete
MILIIRPKKDSKDLLEDLNKINSQFHFEQFSTYKIIDFDFDFDPNHFFLISSKQTIRSLQRKSVLKNQLAKKGKIFVIGSKVEKELKKLNFKMIIKTFLNSNELVSHIKKNYKNQICINHLTGSIANKKLVVFSKTKKVNLNFIKTYTVKFKRSISDTLKNLFKQKKIQFMFHYSLKASEVFYETLLDDQKFYFKNRMIHFCMSRRIQKGLLKLNISPDQAYVAKMANHDSLMLLFHNNC